MESAEEARRAVAATRYPPAGIRGMALLQRGNRYGTVPDYLTAVNDQICLLVQIESRAGLENLEAICAVEGVDGIFIGPSDLSAALGHLGNPRHAEVQEAMKTILPAHGGMGDLSASSPLRRRLLAATWNRVPVSWRSVVTLVCYGPQRRSSGKDSDKSGGRIQESGVRIQQLVVEASASQAACKNP